MCFCVIIFQVYADAKVRVFFAQGAFILRSIHNRDHAQLEKGKWPSILVRISARFFILYIYWRKNRIAAKCLSCSLQMMCVCAEECLLHFFCYTIFEGDSCQL